MKEVTTSSKAIPANPRSKNYPAGASVVRTGGGNTTIIQPGGGSDVDIIKSTDSKSATDKNVLSALKSILEFLSKNEDGTAKGVIDFLNGIKLNGGLLDGIIKKGEATSPSDSNVFSAIRTLSEILANNEELLKKVLRKDQPEQTEHLLKLLGGIFVRGGIDTDSIKSELVDAIKVLATDIDAAETVSGKNVLAAAKVAGQNLEAADAVKGNYIEATEAVKGKNAAISGKTTTLNLLVQQLAEMYDLNVSHVATFFRTIIKDYVSSETFIPGLMGEGMKIYKALNGDWNLEIDNVVVRKVMTIFELVVSKIRSVNGGLVISPANGRIKSVAETTGDPAYYVLGIEGDNQFVADDLVRCQVFTSGQAKYYWVSVASVTADSILILKSEFADGATPAPGDDLVQMGNRTNKARQGFLYLTASEDGKPRFSVMDGVNSTSTVGKYKVILGCLDGITDTDFPADFQPSGYGLYAMNVFLKGVFLLRNGKTVESEVESAKNDAQTARDKADAVTRLFQEFTVAGGIFESKISEVKTYADGKVDGLQIGGRNLALYSGSAITNDYYCVVNYELSEELIAGCTYTITLFGQLGEGKAYFGVWMGGGSTHVGYLKKTGEGEYQLYFTAPNTVSGNGRRDRIDIYSISSEVVVTSSIYKFKLERGDKSTDWTPAPEDVSADAQTKANAAQAAAEAVALAQAALAKTEASAYADGIVSVEEQRAIADAQAKLDEAKRDAQNKANDAKQAAINDAAGKYSTITDVQSSIRQTKDEINLSVSEKISNVQVGGRNYFKKSTIVSLLDGSPTIERFDDGNGVYLVGDSSGESAVRIGNVIDSNGWWTISFDIKGSQSTPVGFYVDFCDCSYIGATSTNDNEYSRRSASFNVTNYTSDTYAFIDLQNISWAYIYLHNIKIEKGNKATDWTPAPEDVQTQITANAAAIEVNSRGIALKASQEQVNGLGNRLTSAEGSLTVQAGQISAQVGRIDGLTGRMNTAEAKITDDAIRLTVSEQTKNTAIEYANLAAKLAGAKMLYRDPTFKQGFNGINVYNNSGNGTVVINRMGTQADNPTDSGYQLVIMSNGYSNQPGRGGFYFGNPVHIYGEYICKFIAWIPVGSNVCFATNSLGDGGYQKWLTPTAGQGKWAEYVSYVRGGTANTSTTNFYNLDGGAETLNWWLCYATVFECSSAEDTPTRDEVKAGIGITSGGITVFGKVISLVGAVTFSSLDSDSQNRITAAQNAANAANGAAGTAQNTANDAVNKANAAQGTANTGVANASAAQGTANDAWNRANNAQTSANNVDSALGSLRNSLGGLAYDNAVTLAKLDSTIIDGGYIKTNLINARAIVTGALIAEQIAATNITTGKLNVTDGAFIGGLKVSGNSLTNEGHDNNAYIILRNNPKGTFVGIGSNVLPAMSYPNRAVGKFACNGNYDGMSNTALILEASGSSRDNIALDMRGKIKTDGNICASTDIDTYNCWIGGREHVTLRFVNGLLAGWWYRK